MPDYPAHSPMDEIENRMEEDDDGEYRLRSPSVLHEHGDGQGRDLEIEDTDGVDVDIEIESSHGTDNDAARDVSNDVDLEGDRERDHSSLKLVIDPALQSPSDLTPARPHKKKRRTRALLSYPDDLDLEYDVDPTSTRSRSPTSHRIRLDTSYMKQSNSSLIHTRNLLLEENARLMADLKRLDGVVDGNSEVDGPEGPCEQTSGRRVVEGGDEPGERNALMHLLEQSLRQEIDELKARLDGSSSEGPITATERVTTDPAADPEEIAIVGTSAIGASTTSSGPVSTATTASNPTSTSTLYTLIAHLDSSIHTHTQSVESLKYELNRLVQQDLLAHRTSRDAIRGRLWRDTVRARRQQHQSQLQQAPTQTEPDEESAEDEGELEMEEKELMDGGERNELERAILDMRGYAEVSIKLWNEENRLPDASNYLNPAYPVFALPYVPKKMYRIPRGRAAMTSSKKDISTELRRLIARRVRGRADVALDTPIPEDSASRTFEPPKDPEEEESPLVIFEQGRKRLALVPAPSEPRLPKKRGRPSLLDMRMKGLEPTIFESLTISAELNTRAIEGMGSRVGIGMGPTLLPDDVIYPDPPPNVPMWDPSNPQFHTQVPYQIQMARQEMASRLARSFAVPAVDMADYLPEMADNDAARPRDELEDRPGSSSEQRQGSVPDFSLEDLERHGLFDHEIPQPLPQAEKTQQERENAAAYNKMQDLAVRELTCENCGRTGTSVWRKLTIGEDTLKRTYRVCNPCGLHYQKNSVMRPKDIWGDVSKAPRKRRHAKPRGFGSAGAAANQQQADQLLQQQIEHIELGHEGTLQMEMDLNPDDHIS